MGETVAARARRSLAEAGGIASTHHIAAQLALSPRRIRDALRQSARVRALGGGYFALKSAPFAPLDVFTEHWLRRNGPQPLDTLIEIILSHYPRGHRLAVRRWLQQEPGRFQRRPGTDLFELTPQRWKDTLS